MTLQRRSVAALVLTAAVVLTACEVADPTDAQRIADPQPSMAKTFDDIRYGSEEAQRLDVYQPGARNGGVIVWLHGGGWADRPDDVATFATEEAAGMQPVVKALYHRGWTIVSVGYTDVGAAPLPRQVLDAKLAVRWVRRHAGSLGVSPDAVVAMGWSAGGHLAALVGTSAGELEPESVPVSLVGVSSRPDLVVSIEGVLDPLTFADTPGVFESNPAVMASALGCEGRASDWKTCNPSLLDAVRPTTYLDVDDPPIYIVAGDRDGIVELRSQALAPYAAYAEVLGEARALLDVVDTGEPADHGGVDPRNHSVAVSYELNAEALFQFVDAVLPALVAGGGMPFGRAAHSR